MIDRLFTVTLVFSLAAFATVTLLPVMFVAPEPAPRTVQLERVLITATDAPDTRRVAQLGTPSATMKAE